MWRPTAYRRYRRPGLEELERRDVLAVTFVDSGQEFGSSVRALALGDLDGDGDLDAFVASWSDGNTVWLNVGDGIFGDSGQRFGPSYSRAVALGDVNGDGDLDAFVTNFGRPDDQIHDRVWLNDGLGQFTVRGQLFGDPNSRVYAVDVDLGDLDGDGDLDALVIELLGEEPKLWANDGEGNFSSTDADFGHADSILIGDVDNDGDLDVLTQVHSPLAYRVWLNDGIGNFTENGQPLKGETGIYQAEAVLGDVDGDGDIDVVGVCGCQQQNRDRVWLNDGNGNFTDSGQELGDGFGTDIALGDLDRDGDLDAFVTNHAGAFGVFNGILATIRLNNGAGIFQESVIVDESVVATGRVDLGDLDGDGDLDAIVATSGGIKIFLNQNVPNPLHGDANRDLRFDQQDVVQVLQAAKYLTGEPATWSEGDWNGDGLFDQIDLVLALQSGKYLQGPNAAADSLFAAIGG